MTSIFTSNIAIHFTNQIENNEHYIYDVELENVLGSGPVQYDMSNLYCNNGINVLETDDFDLTLINSKTLLFEGFIPIGTERVYGVVAFKKDIINTNDTPIFEYDEVEVKTYIQKL